MSGSRSKISAVILAGGRNLRMRREKALLMLGEKPVIHHQIRILRHVFNELIIVAREKCGFQESQALIVKDVIPDLGPIGGLYTGLTFSSSSRVFLIGCDMPFINVRLLNYMLSQAQGAEIVVPVSSKGVEPLSAIYSRSCLKTIKRQISRGGRRLSSLLPHHQVRYLSRQEIAPIDAEGNSFFNMNTPSDYQRAQEIWSTI